MATATITGFGIQAGTDRTVYATWDWSEEHTKGYNVKWYYDTGDTNGSGTIWFIGDDSEITEKQSTYSAPANAKRVRFVVKPVSEQKDANNSTSVYWTAEWSTEKIYNFPVTFLRLRQHLALSWKNTLLQQLSTILILMQQLFSFRSLRITLLYLRPGRLKSKATISMLSILAMSKLEASTRYDAVAAEIVCTVSGLNIPKK